MGSFEEKQAQLSWLASQPHKHKVIIAGNHDVLFDDAFLATHTDRFPVKPGETAKDLDFGDVIYLQDSSVTLNFPEHGDRQLKIYGSPTTPAYVDSVFQVTKHMERQDTHRH